MFAGKFQFTDGCARIWLGLNAKYLASHLKDNASNWTVQNLNPRFIVVVAAAVAMRACYPRMALRGHKPGAERGWNNQGGAAVLAFTRTYSSYATTGVRRVNCK